MEIINYSGKKSYNQTGRKNLFRKETNRFRFSSATAVVAPRNYGLKNFAMALKDAALLLLKTVLRIVEIVWFIPAAIACIYFPKKSVDEYAFQEGFANPVEVCVDNDVFIEKLDLAMANFAMEDKEYIDAWGNIVDGDDSAPLPKVFMLQPVEYYNATFKKGETITQFLKRNGLSNISTAISLNNIPNDKISSINEILAGTKLRLSNMDGIIHTVSNGDTVKGIANKYSTKDNPITYYDLLDVNGLESDSLKKGQELFIPGAALSASRLEKAMGERFRNPLKAKYTLTSKFGRRVDPITGRQNSNHTGIDMACPTGTPIYASMSGTVEMAGWSNTYGNYVIISHKENYQTLYAHMSKITAVKGTKIAQGDKVGLVGSTGYSTGPHLHFTVYKNGKLIDPMTILK